MNTTTGDKVGAFRGENDYLRIGNVLAPFMLMEMLMATSKPRIGGLTFGGPLVRATTDTETRLEGRLKGGFPAPCSMRGLWEIHCRLHYGRGVLLLRWGKHTSRLQIPLEY